MHPARADTELLRRDVVISRYALRQVRGPGPALRAQLPADRGALGEAVNAVAGFGLAEFSPRSGTVEKVQPLNLFAWFVNGARKLTPFRRLKIDPLAS